MNFQETTLSLFFLLFFMNLLTHLMAYIRFTCCTRWSVFCIHYFCVFISVLFEYSVEITITQISGSKNTKWFSLEQHIQFPQTFQLFMKFFFSNFPLSCPVLWGKRGNVSAVELTSGFCPHPPTAPTRRQSTDTLETGLTKTTKRPTRRTDRLSFLLWPIRQKRSIHPVVSVAGQRHRLGLKENHTKYICATLIFFYFNQKGGEFQFTEAGNQHINRTSKAPRCPT